jgi:hypothetical protein
MKILSRRFNSFGWMSTIALSGLLLTTCQVHAQADSPEATVQRLYRNFPLRHESIVDQDRAILSTYFDAQLVNLILQDRACAARTHRICNLDFDILYNTQDGRGIAGLQIGTFDTAAQTITVTFRNSNTPQQVIYQMEQTPTGWRIENIQYSPEESLRAILSEQ